MIDDTMIRKAADLLNEAAQPVRIILFGSHARGDAGEDSDVDLLVVESDVRDAADEMARLRRVLSPLRIPVDLLVVSEKDFREWRNTPGNTLYEAALEGKLLHERT